MPAAGDWKPSANEAKAGCFDFKSKAYFLVIEMDRAGDWSPVIKNSTVGVDEKPLNSVNRSVTRSAKTAL